METLPHETFEKYLSCFSGHTLEWKGILYPSVEHAYHCERYEDPEVLATIMAADTPRSAWEISQSYKHTQRPGWDEMKRSVMKELFRAKLAQHADVYNALSTSGDAAIVKHQSDAYWGDNLDGSGQNVMGKVWMELRAELQPK